MKFDRGIGAFVVIGIALAALFLVCVAVASAPVWRDALRAVGG